MPFLVWTRQRTTWHEPRRGWFSLPPAVRGHQVWLDELPLKERTLFKNLLKRSPNHLLVLLAGRVRAVARGMLLETKSMTDATELEQAAMAAALPPLGEYVASIGMHRPLEDYTKAEVLTLISVVVTAYQDHIAKFDEIPF